MKLSTVMTKLLAKHSLGDLVSAFLQVSSWDKLLLMMSNRCVGLAYHAKGKRKKHEWMAQARILHRAYDEIVLEQKGKKAFKVSRRDIYECPKCKKRFYRLPREERMKGYKDVELRNFDYFFDEFPRDVTPVAIELKPTAEMLTQFEHPDNALYVFGPEDGSIGRVHLQHCHRIVAIPLAHCANLAAAVYMVLYDRMLKRQQNGKDPLFTLCDALKEDRGWVEPQLYDGGISDHSES